MILAIVDEKPHHVSAGTFSGYKGPLAKSVDKNAGQVRRRRMPNVGIFPLARYAVPSLNAHPMRHHKKQ
jgi:hypothetical protein